MRSERELVAEGQVEGHVVQVFKAMTARGADYTFRIVKADKIVHDDPARYDSVQTAFDAAVMFLIPNAEPLHMPPASEKDLDALNALLYVGGLQEDITSAEEAVMFKATFEHALEAVRAVREQAPKDLDAARLIVASTHGAFHKAALDISKISGIFDAQCLVFEMILERSIETIDAFLTGYGQ
jgi:hypothetical protein